MTVPSGGKANRARVLSAPSGQWQHDSERSFAVIRPDAGQRMGCGAEMYLEFEEVKPNTAKSTRGLTVQCIPHGGILCEDASG